MFNLVGSYSYRIKTAQLTTIALNHCFTIYLFQALRVVETLKLSHTPDDKQETITLLSQFADNIKGSLFQVCQKKDGAFSVLYVSPGCRELCEIESKEIQADWQVLDNLIYPQDLPSLIESVTVSVSTLASWCWEGRIMTKSGKLKWIKGVAQITSQANGDLVWNGMFMDISHHKLLERKLIEVETRYQAILTATPDLVLRISRDGEYLEMLGDEVNFPFPVTEILGKNLRDLLPYDVAVMGKNTIAQALNSKTWQVWEYSLLTPLGKREYQARLVACGTNEVLALVRDITECKKATAQLHLAAQRDRLLTETLARIRSSLKLEEILQITVTEVRQFLQVDRVFIGLNNTNLGARTVAESVDPKYPSILGWSTDDEAYLKELKSLFASNRVRVVEDTSKISASAKLKSHYQITQTKASLAVPIILEDELLGALIANQCSRTRNWQNIEIDLLKQMSEQLAIALQHSLIYEQLAILNSDLERQVEERTGQLQQKMQELEELHRVKDVVLHTVAHDLRTSVMGNLMVLQHLLNSQKLREHQNNQSPQIPVSASILERMIQGNEYQLEMLDSLLEIRACEKKELILSCQLVEFRTVINKIITELQPLFCRNQSTVNNLIPDNLPLVTVDIGRLQKVLTHLFTHSLQQNPPGLNFTIKAKVTKGMMRVQIQDHGIAISKTECDRLFDLYIRDPQAPCSTSIGLKMYLCKQIIQAHHGEIGATTSQQHGLTFWFTLPLADQEAGGLS